MSVLSLVFFTIGLLFVGSSLGLAFRGSVKDTILDIGLLISIGSVFFGLGLIFY